MSEQHPTPTTLRDILEAIRDRHKPVDRIAVDGRAHGVKCDRCGFLPDWPCPDRLDADAGIRMLDEAERWLSKGEMVLLPDPVPSDETRETPHA